MTTTIHQQPEAATGQWKSSRHNQKNSQLLLWNIRFLIFFFFFSVWSSVSLCRFCYYCWIWHECLCPWGFQCCTSPSRGRKWVKEEREVRKGMAWEGSWTKKGVKWVYFGVCGSGFNLRHFSQNMAAPNLEIYSPSHPLDYQFIYHSNLSLHLLYLSTHLCLYLTLSTLFLPIYMFAYLSLILFL